MIKPTYTQEDYEKGDIVRILPKDSKFYKVFSFDEKSQTVKAKEEISYNNFKDEEVTFNLLDEDNFVIPF